MRHTTSLIFLVSAAALVTAQNITEGQPCNLQRNRLTPTTHQFLSECVPTAYCDPATLTCKPKGCRTEEFPFKYPQDATLPPMCGSGMFCPDEEDQCLPLQPVGQNCQLNRDDQCEPQPSVSGVGPWSNNGAVCLDFTCYWQNATNGAACVLDNVVYTGYRADGTAFATIISRDNCQPGMFCDGTALTCKQQLDLNQQCGSDKECQSHNCGTDNLCKLPAGTVIKIPLWQYILTGVGIGAFITIILVTLFVIHRRQRAKTQREIREYFHEQTTYRSSIIALHTAARERTSSIFSGSESRFSQYDEHGQMIYRDDDSQRHLLGGRRSTDGYESSMRQSRLRESVIVEDEDSDEERAQGKAFLSKSAAQSRLSFDQETPRQSFDYGQASGSTYSAVPMRQSVDLPMGAGAPKRGDFKDPWSN